MIPGVNPKQMQAMMKRMGIAQKDLHATKVTFETPEGNLVINNPEVLEVKMQGSTTYQVSGEAIFSDEEQEEKYTEDDIEMVISQTQKSREEVINTLEKNDGDIAESIIQLKE